jgi:hypothetical protein
MGIDVALMQVTQRGTSPKGRTVRRIETFFDDHDIFSSMCQSSGLPTLTRATPHGLLILTPTEMDQLVSELDQLIRQTRDREKQGTLSNVRELAERCRDLKFGELHFEGD